MTECKIYVRDFVTLPCADAAPGIRRAVARAKETGAAILEFEAGVYSLRSAVRVDTDLCGHDAAAVPGAVFDPFKEVFIPLAGLSDLRVTGKTDADGRPATVLEGGNDGERGAMLPSILWVDGGANLTVANLKFTRREPFGSAGRVESVSDAVITLSVPDGNPIAENMGTYCMNRFSPDGTTLVGASLSYGPGLGIEFVRTGARTLSLASPAIAKKVKPGEIVSFHQGSKTDFQCFFGNVENLLLENLHTVNSNGFAFLAFNIHNLTVRRVRFAPEGNMRFTAPRDAFKLHKCSGKITVSGMWVEGVRMDGQNMHNNYLNPIEVISPREVAFFSRGAYLPMRTGSDIGFADGLSERRATVADWRCEGAYPYENRNGYRFTVRFDSSLDFEVTPALLCLAHGWEPDSYECTDSDFVNVAGAGHLARIPRLAVRNCRYRNLMNSGILLGAELPGHAEGGHIAEALIENCEFTNCGATARYGARGCIGVKSAGFAGAYNRNIRIEGCSFAASPIGVDLHDAGGVSIANCRFDGVETPVVSDPDTTEKIQWDGGSL